MICWCQNISINFYAQTADTNKNHDDQILRSLSSQRFIFSQQNEYFHSDHRCENLSMCPCMCICD